jgi:hypothetical protein
VDARLDADASKKQLELLNNIRLDRYYAGVSIPLLGNLSSLNIEDVDIEFSPAAKISRSPGKINVLFSTIPMPIRTTATTWVVPCELALLPVQLPHERKPVPLTMAFWKWAVTCGSKR